MIRKARKASRKIIAVFIAALMLIGGIAFEPTGIYAIETGQGDTSQPVIAVENGGIEVIEEDELSEAGEMADAKPTEPEASDEPEGSSSTTPGEADDLAGEADESVTETDKPTDEMEEQAEAAVELQGEPAEGDEATASALISPEITSSIGQMAFDTQYTGQLSDNNLYDEYTIVLPQTGRLKINVTRPSSGGASYFNVDWYNDSGVNMASSTYNSSYGAYMDLEARSYRIRVSRYSSSYSGTYYITASFAAAGNNETEPNNTIDQTQTLSSGQEVKGFISYQDGIDYYKCVLTQAGRLTVNVTKPSAGGAGRFDVDWYNGSGVNIASSTYNSSYTDYIDLEAGTYFIRVSKYSSSYTGTYFISTTSTVAGNNETEPNNTIDQAQTLSSGQEVKGFISYQDGSDYYKCVLTQAGRLTVNVTKPSAGGAGRFDVDWYNGSGVNIASSTYNSSYTDYIDLEAGTYFIRVSKYSSSYTGTYFISTAFTAAGNNEAEPNNTIDQAQALASGQEVKGFFSYQDGSDYYKCVLTQAGRLTVNVTKPSGGVGRFDVDWYNSNGVSIKSETYNSTYNSYMDLEAGTYFIWISKYSSSYTGSYNLMAQGPLQPPAASTLTVSPATWSASSSGAVTSVTVTSNTQWTAAVNGSLWLSISKSSGSNDGSFTITAAANAGTS